MMNGMDVFTERAIGVLKTGGLRDALDISKEHPRVRDRYGDGKPYKFQYDGAPTVNEHFRGAGIGGRYHSRRLAHAHCD